MTADARIDDLLQELAPRVLGGLVRRYQDLAVCEDAVQDALVAAAQHWPKEGVPSNPRSWLVTTARRAVVDEWRSVRARRRRDETVAALEPPDQAPPPGQDDSLALLLMCCHPVLPVPSQLALTLRAVGGLTTTEIARAFLVPEATMAKRISRAKQQLRSEGVRFGLPPTAEWAGRLQVVLHVQRGLRLHLGSGPQAARPDHGGHPAGAVAAPACAGGRRSRGVVGADAAHRRPACRANHRRRLRGAPG